MTNQELIEQLQKLPPDADVYIDAYDHEGSHVLITPHEKYIAIDEDGDIIIEI